MAKRPRVLVIAEAANPTWVSVPLVGWNTTKALRQVADVHIVTQVRNREAIVSHGLVEGRDFTAIDSEALAAPFYRMADRLRGGAGKGWTTVTALQSLSYPYFEHLAWQRFGASIKAGAFDIVHRVTPLSPTSPSLLARRCRRAGVPFLLGPLNGGLPWHPEFSRERIKEREWLSFVRKVYSFLPMVRATYRNASAIIAGSTHTASELARFRRPSIYIPENGIDTDRFQFVARSRSSDDPLRLIFVGRLVPYKGADIAIEACRDLLRSGRAKLEIIGDGPDFQALGSLIERLGVNEGVTMHGWKTHEEVAQHLQRADIMIFPSVREFGGGVVLEAMASGVVPMVVDYGGPGELVNRATGFAVPISSRRALVQRFSELISSVAKGDHDLSAMSGEAAKRVEELYSWRAKASQLRTVYDWLLSGNGAGTPPDFEFIN